jgi:hypothetical protein
MPSVNSHPLWISWCWKPFQNTWWTVSGAESVLRDACSAQRWEARADEVDRPCVLRQEEGVDAKKLIAKVCDGGRGAPRWHRGRRLRNPSALPPRSS